MNAFDGGELRRVLEQKFDLQDYSGIPDFPFCEYSDEDSLEPLLIKWNHSVVSEALAKAQSFLNGMHDPIYMVRGGQAESPYPGKNWKPDWGCVRRSQLESPSKRKNLLPGDSKVSAKWSSKLIETGEIVYSRRSRDWMRPISQIYSYCARNNTRYGYIITDTELVAVRIRLGQQYDLQTSFDTATSAPKPMKSVIVRARTEGVLEYKAIPWADGRNGARGNSKRMTINLALWWLHLIATGKTGIGEDYGSLRDALREQDAKGQQQSSEDQAQDAQTQLPCATNQAPDTKSMGLDQVSI